MGLGVVCSSAGVPVGAWATQGGISFKTSEVGVPVGAWATQGGISFKTSEAGGVRGGLKGFPPCVHLNGRHSSPANQAKSLASLISVSGLPLAGPVSFVATAMPRTQSASISLRAVGGEHRSVRGKIRGKNQGRRRYSAVKRRPKRQFTADERRWTRIEQET